MIAKEREFEFLLDSLQGRNFVLAEELWDEAYRRKYYRRRSERMTLEEARKLYSPTDPDGRRNNMLIMEWEDHRIYPHEY